MKKSFKIISVVLAFVLILAAVLLVIFLGDRAPEREVFVYGDFEYTFIDDKKVQIYAYRGSDSDVTLPTLIDGYTVASVGEFAFSGSKVASVTLGALVSSIEGYAFSKCENLSQITFNDGLVSVGPSAFFGCTALKEISLPDTLASIGEAAFADCYAISSFKSSSDLQSMLIVYLPLVLSILTGFPI